MQSPSPEKVAPQAAVSGTVAVLGRPNAGKSTLLNALLGEKVSIVSPKPQTTRQQVRGILHLPGAQIVLLDTPGYCAPDSLLQRAMRKTVGSAAASADVNLVVCDVGSPREVGFDLGQTQVFETVAARGQPLVIALNKVDLLPNRDWVLPWIDHCRTLTKAVAIVPLAARRGEGLDNLVAQLRAQLPEGAPQYDEALYTDRSERFLCAELIREQLLYQTHQEVPHTCAVTIEEFADGRRDPQRPRCRLVARIYVARDSQKGIVVGQGGQQIKAIGSIARQRIGQLLGCPTDLALSVHVDAQWPQNEGALRRYNLLAEQLPC